MKDDDRRRFRRMDQKFMVKFKSIGGAHHRDVGDRAGLVLNISRGGLVLASKREFPVDTLFTIKIPKSELGPEREVKGKVVWSRPADESGEYVVGCMFVRIVEPEGEDRRQYERKPVKLALSLQCGEEESIEGQLVDLSQGGIEFTAPVLFKKGSMVRVGFPASPLGGARVVFVEVLRHHEHEGEGWWRTAGRFVHGK